jgi:glycine/D-amino acid oxidase-like deaminating enzyme
VRIVHPNETERLKRNVEMQRGLGINVELISGDEVRNLEPDWRVDEVQLAAYEPDSGYGDGAVVANDFLARARDMGACYYPRSEVTGFVLVGGKVCGVKTNQGEIHAPTVIAATGPWTRPLFHQIGYELPIETEYHQVAILKKPSDLTSRSACIDSGSQTYFRPDGQDKFLLGDFFGTRPVDPDSFPQRCSDESLEVLIERACRRIPKLEHAEVMRGVTGVYDDSRLASTARADSGD